MSKVYVVNNSGHDYTKAKSYGELVYLSEGRMNRFKLNNMYRQFAEVMEDSSEEDYILVTGLAQMVAIAASIQAYKFGKVNFLLYSHRDDDYVPRELTIGNLIDIE